MSDIEDLGKVKSVVQAYAPKMVDLEEGKTYAWCACGRSDGIYCNGSHAKVGHPGPKVFTAEKNTRAALCQCKQTKNPPYCDGSHVKLKAAAASAEAEAGKGAASKGESVSGTAEEPTLGQIKALARGEYLHGHGEMVAMGVPRPTLPQWDDIQVIVAQLARQPLLDGAAVGTEFVLGPRAKKPLRMEIPLFVSDMSFGALSEEAKTALATGAELAGTGICSGEGGMLAEEQASNSRYLFEIGSAKFGFDLALLDKVQAVHFKGGQGAKTGTGGHLPGAKNVGKISATRGLKEGTDAVSPATFTDMHSPADFKAMADKARAVTGGAPVGFKISANHIEQDIQFALDASADYIILDGRGGATGAAPSLFRDNISVPTIPALARARRYLDKVGVGRSVSLIITGGLRVPADFVKAMCLGADAVAVSNAALQSIGCVAARMCNTNQCPAGIATQDAALRKVLDVDKGARQLSNFFKSSAHQMQILARACGHDHLNKFEKNDIATWKYDMHRLAGVPFSGFGE